MTAGLTLQQNLVSLNMSVAYRFPGYYTLSTMKKSFSFTQSMTVDYFFMPERHGRPAEIITILNNPSRIIQVPTREEDLELKSFYRRPATESELIWCGSAPVWKVFCSWQELEEDHLQAGVAANLLQKLSRHAEQLEIRKEIAA